MTNDTRTPPAVVTPDEVADMLTITVEEVLHLANDGHLRGARYGDDDQDWRFARWVIEEYRAGQ